MEFALSDHKQAIESCRDGLQSGEWQRRQAIALTGSEEHGQNLRVHDWSPRLDISPPLPLQALCCGWWDLAELDPGSQSDLRTTRLAPAVQQLSPLTGMCWRAADKQAGPVDAGTVATSVVGITGAVALLVAGTATLKYWQVRSPPQQRLRLPSLNFHVMFPWL